MTENDKKLLTRDLCARLAFPAFVHVYPWASKDYITTLDHVGSLLADNKDIKPYLRSMNSMTEKEREEWKLLTGHSNDVYDWIYVDDYDSNQECLYDFFDWIISHHFDYRGLIEKGLALEAPEGMYSLA